MPFKDCKDQEVVEGPDDEDCPTLDPKSFHGVELVLSLKNGEVPELCNRETGG